jgi:Replication-relaxation
MTAMMRREGTMIEQATARKRAAPSARVEEALSRLSAVDFRLLQWLLHYPFQRADDLVIGLARWASRPTVYRHVAQLQQLGLLERVLPKTPGSGKSLYALSNLGLHVCAAHVTTSPQELAARWRADERGLLHLLPRLPCLLVIQDVVNGLVSHTADAMARQGKRPALIRWNWQRDYGSQFSYREQVTRLTADGAFAMCVRATLPAARHSDEWYSMLFLHTGLNDARLMRLRLDRILRWRECAERWPLYQHLPLVVVLATSARQSEQWQHAAEEAAMRLRLAPLLGAIACLPTGGTEMGNPWLLAWRTLATSAQCHLQDLLTPLPLAAIPSPLLPAEAEDVDGELPTGPGASAVSLLKPRLGAIIVGNFDARAAKVGTDDSDERARMALLGLRLTPRLWSLLFLLLAHPLLSACELASFSHLQLTSVRCFLYELRALDCIAPVITEVGKRWRLSGRGLRLLAAAHHFSVRNLALAPADDALDIVQRGQEWLLLHIQHTAGIYGFFASLAQAAQRERGRAHALLWWETGAACERRYQARDRWYNLKPDALAEYQRGEQRVRFWLEWDRGTMNARDLAIKFTSYAQYVASREWARERSVLPLLLCVAPDIAQEQRLLRVARSMLTNAPGLVVHSTTAPHLAAPGPLAAIWLQGAPPIEHPVQASSLRHSLFAVGKGGS